jgi:hypothetical protein
MSPNLLFLFGLNWPDGGSATCDDRGLTALWDPQQDGVMTSVGAAGLGLASRGQRSLCLECDNAQRAFFESGLRVNGKNRVAKASIQVRCRFASVVSSPVRSSYSGDGKVRDRPDFGESGDRRVRCCGEGTLIAADNNNDVITDDNADFEKA